MVVSVWVSGMPWVGSAGPVGSAILLLNLVQNVFQHVRFHLNRLTTQAGKNCVLQWTPVVSLCGPFCSLPWPVAWPDLATFDYTNFCLTTDPKCTYVHQKFQMAVGQIHFSVFYGESWLTSHLNFQSSIKHIRQSKHLRPSYLLLKVVSEWLLVLSGSPKIKQVFFSCHIIC